MQKLIDYLSKKFIKYIWGSQKAYNQVNKIRVIRFKKIITKSNKFKKRKKK